MIRSMAAGPEIESDVRDTTPPSPPDPQQYDSERNTLARARGLAAPYIAGGEDADREKSAREARIYGRLLLLMILLIVGTSVALTFIAIALGYAGFDSG
jgi:hypothetical protein